MSLRIEQFISGPAVDYLGDVLILMGLDGAILDANAAALDCYRYSRAEILGLSIYDLKSPDEQEPLDDQMHEALGRGVRLQRVHRRSDGSLFPVEVLSVPVSVDGETAMIGIITDLSERREAEEALLRTESLLRGIADASTSLVYATDLDGRFIFANRRLEELFGVSADGLVGRTREGFLPAADCDQHRANDLRVIESGLPLTTEEVNAEGGATHTYLSVKSPLIGADGRVAAVAGISTDISERKKIEADRIENETRLQALLDNAPYGAHMYELQDDDRLVFVGYNRRAEEVLGVDHAPMVGKTLEEAFPANVGTGTPEACRRVAREGGTWETDQYAYDSEGTAGVFQVYAFSFGPSRVSVFFSDVTERKRAERALLESELLTSSILATTPNLIYIYDLVEHRNVYTNQEVTDFLGYTPEQVQGFGSTLFDRILHPDDAAHVATHHARCAEAGDSEVLDVEYRMKHSSGEWRWLRSRDVPYVRDDRGLVTRILGFTEDVTERKQAEDQLQELAKSLESRVEERTRELDQTIEQLTDANEAKTRFLRSMSHELRTPLNSIIGFSSILSDGIPGEVNEEQGRQLAMINNSGRHLLALINDILDLSRIDADQVEIDVEPIDVAAMIDELVLECGPSAETKGLVLMAQVAEPAPRLVSDPRRVRQILLNLLGNAIKFTDVGAVVVRVARPSPNLLSFSVSDTGPGIAPEEHERIFGEFERAVGQAPNTEGTGLGLAISRGLAESLGGTLELKSEVGRGSTFTVTLPESPGIDETRGEIRLATGESSSAPTSGSEQR